MFDVAPLTNAAVATLIQDAQALSGVKMAAKSTLLRNKKTANIETLMELLSGNGLAIDEQGTVHVPSAAERAYEEQVAAAQADEAVVQEAINDEGIDEDDEDDLHAIVQEEREEEDEDLAEEDAANPSGVSFEAQEPANPPGVAFKAQEPAKRSGRAPSQSDDAVITVLAASNPHREGSHIAARYELMQSGMTVGQYVAAAVEAGHLARRARRALRKAIAAGHARVD